MHVDFDITHGSTLKKKPRDKAHRPCGPHQHFIRSGKAQRSTQHETNGRLGDPETTRRTGKQRRSHVSEDLRGPRLFFNNRGSEFSPAAGCWDDDGWTHGKAVSSKISNVKKRTFLSLHLKRLWKLQMRCSLEIKHNVNVMFQHKCVSGRVAY